MMRHAMLFNALRCRFKAGLGPAMPNECPECKGKGEQWRSI